MIGDSDLSISKAWGMLPTSANGDPSTSARPRRRMPLAPAVYEVLLQPACTDAVSANLKAVKLYRRPRGRDLPEKVLGCPN